MNESKHRPFQDLSIRFKLLFGYLAVFFLATGIGSLFLYSSIRNTLEKNIEKQLQTSTQLILNIVETSADAAIKNHIRAIAETNEKIVHECWEQYQKGNMTEDEAQCRAKDSLLSQHIGKTGYIYIVDSKGVVQAHPEKSLVGTNQVSHIHVLKQTEMQTGYLEYDWSNPGEATTRPKALYMTYFGPWDWIISATSYRDEFDMLFDVEDLRQSLLSIRFGETGYPYIFDVDGLVILHPNMEGENVLQRRDASGDLLFQKILKMKNGKLTYFWQNPEDPEPREKIVFFNHIKELGWIVASSGYHEELYAPLTVVKVSIILTMSAMLILIIPFTWWFGSSITNPLSRIMQHFSAGISGNHSGIIEFSGRDEIGKLATYYNRFIEQLTHSCQELEHSEKEYRSIYENSWEGIIKVTINGEILSCNPSMARMLGYDSPEQLMNEVDNIKEIYVYPDHRLKFLKGLEEGADIRGFEVELKRRDGDFIWVSLNSRKIMDESGIFSQLETFVTDISQRKIYEAAQEKTKEELEKRVRTRTAELSYRVSELKSLNAQGDLLRELGEHLQVCRETEETYPVIQLFLKKLFPDETVSLYVSEKENEMLDLVMTTSEGDLPLTAFSNGDCWALRKGKAHFAQSSDTDLVCPHWFGVQEEAGSLCVPLNAQDELVGMLQLVVPSENLVTLDGKKKELVQDKGRLAAIVAEHLALALTNIKLRETLRLQSIEDPLTGLYNRRYMLEFMRREMARISRTDTSTSIIMMDVDHFKRFNDEHGHEVGDEVLKKLGVFLRSHVRATDLACRFGGEEFLLVMVDTPLRDCAEKAEELRLGIEESLVVHHGDSRLGVTVSMGIACATGDGETFEHILQIADSALYRAKHKGRNRIELADSQCTLDE